MEAKQVPRALTDEEFDSMIREFDLAGDWMLERLAHKRQVSNPRRQSGQVEMLMAPLTRTNILERLARPDSESLQCLRLK
ncbi:hypothetical protein SAMN03159495_4472 [Pseudomonas sp. NFR16]|nr:hypothetical protein SAMN03159495_4472 [Pseudomonas sp. NFR16]